MLQATVLGSGLSPGQVIHARVRERDGQPGEGEVAKQHLTQPRSFDPSALASSSSAAYTPVTPFNARPSGSSGLDLPIDWSSRADHGDEALTWAGNEVTWSRGAEVVRRFTLMSALETDPVVCALFAWMCPNTVGGGPTSISMSTSSSTSSSASSSSSIGSSLPSAFTMSTGQHFTTTTVPPGTFGPFHTSQHAVWGEAQRPPTIVNSPQAKPERAVVIVLPDQAHFFFASGEDIRVNIPFPVYGAWARPAGGILFQRAPEVREQRTIQRSRPRESLADRTVLDDMDSDPPSPLPTLYAMTERMGDLHAVHEASVAGGIRDPNPTIIPGTLNAPRDTSQTILYVAPDPYPFVVMYDRAERKVLFFRRVTVPVEKEKDEPVPPHKMVLNPDEFMRNAAAAAGSQPPTQPPTQPPRRGRASLPRGPGRASLAPGAVDDRARRKSRLSTMAYVADEELDNIGAAFGVEPGPGPSTVARHRRGGASGAAAEARRSSASGLRMSSAPDKPNAWQFPLGKISEDMRETTMMQGLSTMVKRSEIVLDRIWEWEWRRPGHIDPANTRVFLSDNRSADSVDLNILMSNDSHPTTLFTFHIEVVEKPTPKYAFYELRETPCLAATSIISTRPGVLDTLVVTAEGARLMTSSARAIPIDIPPVVTVDGRDEVARKLASSLSMTLDGGKDPRGGIVDLIDASGSRVTAVYSDGERVRISLDFTLPPGLTRRALEALSYALPPSEFEELSTAVLFSLAAQPPTQRLDPGIHWQVFANALSTKCGIPQAPPPDPRTEMLSAWSTQSDPVLRRLAKRMRPSRSSEGLYTTITPNPSTPRVLYALHLVAQDCRLACTTEPDLSLIAPLIVSLASAVGRADWVDYWRRLMPSALSRAVLTSPASAINTSILDARDEPPDILAFLECRMIDHTRPFPSPESLGSGKPTPLGSPRPCVQTQILTEVYGRMRPSQAERGTNRPVSVDKRACAVVKHLVSNHLSHAWLADLPFGVSIPILEMIRACHTNAPKGMSEEFYAFIGRPDLAVNCQLDKSNLDLPFGEEQPLEEVPTVGQLLDAKPAKAHVHGSVLPHVRFGTDKRLEEIERIMQTTRQRTMAIDPPKGLSESEVLNYHQQVVATISHRTLSITVGQGMFQYSSRTTPVTELWKAPRIELSVKVIPGNTVYNAPLPEGVDWPCFHSGVSSALAYSSNCKGIDASWIGYNRASPPTADHAGFLLGLGLQGHLRVLDARAAETYLEQRHDPTSIAMLLGLGASYAGSQDVVVTKIASLHTVALLPHGSMLLGQHPTVQCAALVALGLTYAGSRKLRMAEITLREISRREMPGIDHFNDHREAYNFSSAAAFGLIMLGRGGLETSEIERQMVKQLTLCIHGNTPDIGLGSKAKDEPQIDTTLTAPGATLALGLMFLKSGRKDMAALLSIPETPLELECVRPEHLLVRTFARALIMWDEVEGTTEWFDAQLPPFIRSQHYGHKRTSHMELNSEVAYFNIMAGACLGLAFRYAGIANENIHNMLTSIFGLFAKAAAGQSMSYEGKIRRNAARQALNIVSLAAAIEMSGTGELGLTRRLRMSHGQEGASINYGSHMAMHMAMGILYLGRGYYTLGNSNLAIAALAISCFPRFLPAMGDNKAYPQAFRHLWALAVEPRCLIARDVDTRESIFLPVKVYSHNSSQPNNLISPTLIAPMDTLKSIVVDSPRYLPVTFDFSDPRDYATLVKTRTIWVKRRAGYINYAADPRGYRSLMVRAGTMSGFDLHYDLISPAAPMTVPPADVIELVTTHSTNPVCIAIARNFAGNTWLEQFARNVLFECLSIDKLLVLGTYLSMALGLHSNHDDGNELLLQRMAQTRFAHRFYSRQVWDRFFAIMAGQKRHPVVRQTFLAALMRHLGVSTSGGAPASRMGYFAADVAPLGDVLLSAYLVRNDVPPAKVLDLLRNQVVADTEEDKEVQVLKCRGVAERYAMAVGGQYGDAAPSPGLWKLESIRDALGVWRGEMAVEA